MIRRRGSVGFTGLIFGLSLLFFAPFIEAEERVRFPTQQGESIDAVYFPPASSKTPAPAIVMLHGCAGLFTKSGIIRSREMAWIDILQHEGWGILLPDSFGSRGYASLCQTRDRPVKPELQRPFDAMAALRFLTSRTEIDVTRIALLGWSNGAMTGLYTVRDGAPAAADLNGIDFKSAVLFYPGCIGLIKAFPDYRPRLPVLIQHGALDDWTLAAPCQELVERVNSAPTAPKMSIDVYPESYHNFDHPGSKLKTITTRHSGYKNGERQVHTGTNPEAREKAITRTIGWLRDRLM